MAPGGWLRLALAPDVGPVMAHRLLAAFGDPEAIFSASPEDLLAVPGVGKARLARLMDPSARRAAVEEVELAAEAGVDLIALPDPNYPELLKRLECPPLVLWVRGSFDPADRLAVAIVGPRTPSEYGRLMAGLVSRPLAGRGLTIVSGLAYGIDAEAHRGALEAGGRTLAVLGQGLGPALYPNANAKLAARIVEEGRGALVSIFPMRTEPAPGLFPQRNEIIAGLALGSLIVEASAGSGALITARHAADAGRVVMACPGDATRRAARGSNRLLADGATLVQEAGDVMAALHEPLRHEMAELGLNPATLDANAKSDVKTGAKSPLATGDGASPAPAAPLLPTDDALTRDLAAILIEEPLPVDAILACAAERGHANAAVLERLLQLEIDGRLRQLPGRIYALLKAWGH